MATLPRPARPASVTTVPVPVPQRSDRANFAARGDAVLGWMPGGVNGINSNIGYLEDSLDYIDQEVAATEANVSASEELLALTTEQAEIAGFTANYKGQWSTLTGALNKPAAVGHGGLFWLLVNNLANVTTSEPGMTNDWERIPGVTEVATPINATPAQGATNVGASSSIVLSANTFGAIYVGDTHVSSQWQMHTSNAFAFPMYDSGEVAASTSRTLPLGVAAISTSYFWRVRYKSSRGTWSAWSRSTSFTTASAFNSYVPTPTATPAIGGALEGGFYGGMVWQQVATSTSNLTLATGPVTLAISVDMHVTPLVYAGQTVEVRSLADPTYKFIGTVTGATGTSLSINCTSIGGFGSGSNWSINVRYRVIKAPKASGETNNLAWKNANTLAPSSSGTLVEGLKSTNGMVAAGDSSVYPLAHWCRNRNIGGYTDWYMPSRDEMEVLIRNLKPGTVVNSTSNRPTGSAHNYQNQGAYPDLTNASGANRNSDPNGAAYTTTVPGQTTPVAFRTGGAEALVAVVTAGSGYWTSTEHAATTAIFIETNDSNFGLPTAKTKNLAGSDNYVIAVRRSMI